MLQKKGFLFICFSLVVLCLCGCPISSPFPLGPVEKAPFDKELLGEWRQVEADEKEGTVLMEVFKFNDHEFLFVLEGGDDERVMYRAFITMIDGYAFLNACEIESSPVKDVRFLFVNYSISEDRLYLRIVEDDLIDKADVNIETSAELASFIRAHIGEEGLLDDLLTFERTTR